MIKAITLLIGAAGTLYFLSAFSRPEEPAGRYVRGTVIPSIKEALPECPHIPFSGLLQMNGYQHRPTLRPLEVVPAHRTPYTPEELAEIYPTH